MAALSITAANVGTNSTSCVIDSSITYGETITQGQPVYRKASDQLYYKADANASSATAEAIGIAMTSGAANQPGVICKGGNIKIGATTAVGQIYCVGATAGEIVPYGDLTTGDYVTILGYGSSTSTIFVDVTATGYVKP